MPVCPLCPAELEQLVSTRCLGVPSNCTKNKDLADQDSIQSHERTCGLVAGQFSGMLPTSVETLVSHLFSGFFLEKAGYTCVCIWWYCVYPAHWKLESLQIFFFACVRTCTRMCAYGVNMECVGCMRQLVPHKKQDCIRSQTRTNLMRWCAT